MIKYLKPFRKTRTPLNVIFTDFSTAYRLFGGPDFGRLWRSSYCVTHARNSHACTFGDSHAHISPFDGDSYARAPCHADADVDAYGDSHLNACSRDRECVRSHGHFCLSHRYARSRTDAYSHAPLHPKRRPLQRIHHHGR